MMHRLFVIGLLLLVVTGCEPMEVDEPAAEVEVAVATPPSPQPAAPAVTFGSTAEALSALAEATDAKDSERQKAAYNWLSQQDGSAVPAVVAAMNDTSASIEARRMACRVLSQLGPTAAAPLVVASQSKEPQLQIKAIEAMPAIEPQQKIVVDRLIALLDDKQDPIRRAAIRSLGQIGPAAERSAKRLIALQNDVSLDEMTRDEAARALHRVNPRRTFND